MSRIIAIDGPSGAGKSTLARQVGARLGFWHVDSGALYRIITWQCLLRKIDPADAEAVAACAEQVEVTFSPRAGSIEYLVDGCTPGNAIRTPEINLHASPVATVKAVRDQVTLWLRGLTRFGDLIVEGRDITTAVFPDTPARFYLVASAEVRAERRHREEVEQGIAHQTSDAVKASLLRRDKIDSTRQYAPLKKVEGVLQIDNTRMTIAETVQTLINALPEGWKVRTA